jgi:thioredoxin 1
VARMTVQKPRGIDRRTLLAAAVSYLSGMKLAYAAQKQVYSSVEFKAALASGRPVLVEVTASWCPTCRLQTQAVGIAINQPRFASFTTFVVNIDTQRDALLALGVSVQSTLIVFRNGEEVARSIGEAKRDRIEALMARAL